MIIYLGIEYNASAMSAARLSKISFGSLSGSPVDINTKKNEDHLYYK